MRTLTNRIPIYNLGSAEMLGVVPLRHAVLMLHRHVATVRDIREGPQIGPYPRPASVELVKEVAYAVYARTGTVPYSRDALKVRDRGICGYCGNPGDTMDHIVPKCRGRRADWLNATIACRACNEKKADRTPEEAGMPLLRVPYEPTYLDIYAPR